MKRIIIIIILLSGTFVFAQTYNPEKAVEYADFWWDKRNTQNSPYYDPPKWGGPYYDYDLPQNGGGGDCANFVSQCLIYGGLNLSKGTNGNGNGVKPEGTITGVQNLITHLKEHQRTSYSESSSLSDVYSDHDRGDPAFIGDSFNSRDHSLFCTFVNGSERYYSAHSSNQWNVSRNLYSYRPYTTYFHIKSAYPDNCDCECGDPCPPCEHAPKQKHITTAGGYDRNLHLGAKECGFRPMKWMEEKKFYSFEMVKFFLKVLLFEF